MAAITTTRLSTGPVGLDTVYTVRTATAQASTGQTDWIDTPRGARYAQVVFNLTDVGASTTPIFTPSVLSADPSLRNDSYKIKIAEHTAFTGITAANMLIVDIGPGITGIADDVTNSATAISRVSLNAPIPQLMGITVLNDRTTGDEVYTYTVTVAFYS